MKPIKIVILAVLVLGLAACGQTNQVSRNEPLGTPLVGPAAVTFNVQDVRISVPDSLSVSEANVYYPSADIVWREDAYGERHQQVAAIFQEALDRGVKNLNGNRAVFVDIEVLRFHSLTERARYTVGGVHSIKFNMSLRDVLTGAVIGKPRLVNADLKAYGGKKAVASEHRGLTQKVRILAHLSAVIQREVISLQTAGSVVNTPKVASE